MPEAIQEEQDSKREEDSIHEQKVEAKTTLLVPENQNHSEVSINKDSMVGHSDNTIYGVQPSNNEGEDQS